MTLINNAGVQFGLNTHVLEITSGVLIICAVTMDMLKARKKGRHLCKLLLPFSKDDPCRNYGKERGMS